ncbi:MAG: hypothetical protein WA610_05800 [Thermodesulfovibrionales bacterium]
MDKKPIIEENDEFKRKLLFLSALNREVRDKGIEFIVVGGSAVELYSFGKYQSGDIDIISSGSLSITEILLQNGFTKKGKNFISEELGIFIEIPGRTLSGDPERVKTFVFGEDMSVQVIGVEDLIIDRLQSCVLWKYETDGEWAENLIGKYRDAMDLDYLIQRATEVKVDQELNRILANG